MKKVTIKKVSDNSVLQIAKFEDDKTMDEWIEMLAVNHPWGKPEHQRKVDENDMSLDAEMETVPSEYTIEIIDITAEIEQERVNREAQAYLDSTDLYVIRFIETGVLMPEGMSLERQQARERIIR